MVDYHFSDNTHRKVARQRRIKTALITLSAVTVLVVLVIIIDGLRTKTEITSSPPVVSTLGSQVEQSVFEEPSFRLVTDASWRAAPPIVEEMLNYRFQSYESELVRRELTIYVDSLPSEFPITHVLPVEHDSNKIIPLSISPKCDELQPDKDNRRDVTLTWAGVQFLCDPDFIAPVIGTSNAEDGYGFEFGPSKHRYFFVYRDLEAVPSIEAFPRLLKGFEAK